MLTADRVLTPLERRRMEALRFARSRKVESEYAAKLKQVARQIGEIVKGFAPGTLEDFFQLRLALTRYTELLTPWARKMASRIVEEISRKDASAWIEHGRSMGRELAKEIQQAPTGEVMRKMMGEQVELITSLPRDAAERVHKLTLEGIAGGGRAEAIAEEIERTGHVTRSRAMLIARTETARTASLLTQARAQYVGSTHYVWRSAEDADVRPLHRKLNGKVFAWDDPPVSGESGERSIPGAIYNCRCYPEPIVPDLV